MIAPDEPIRRIGDGLPEEALISPDDPIPEREVPRPDQPTSQRDTEEDDVEVTGMGERRWDFYASGYELRDPDEIASMLEQVARHLREHGPGDLLGAPASSRLESSVRWLVAGYVLRGMGGED